MNRKSKGFTLIELVTVIAILGVLAAMTVPKFFALQAKARVEVEAQIIGTIRAGLETFAANEIVQSGSKSYPVSTTATVLTDILNPVPAGWTYTPGTPGTIVSGRTDSTITWDYSRPSDATYTITYSGDTRL
ncbi:MAG: prepilin-type N-terminal cleavage/methylation domain-containing protein [Candidatus Marinimicrobia bacterium]|nr:prepilin-type N-terminal cleavage/methylation domain-containing protein [Candidatus Neomarinimicrobiota bacterium]